MKGKKAVHHLNESIAFSLLGCVVPSTFSSIAIELNLKNDRKIYLSHRQSVNRV